MGMRTRGLDMAIAAKRQVADAPRADRSPERRPASPRIGRHPRARIALLVVPAIGADAKNSRFACPAASREGHGLEPVIGTARRCSGRARLRIMRPGLPAEFLPAVVYAGTKEWTAAIMKTRIRQYAAAGASD
jgi:hypothetical protein